MITYQTLEGIFTGVIVNEIGNDFMVVAAENIENYYDGLESGILVNESQVINYL